MKNYFLTYFVKAYLLFIYLLLLVRLEIVDYSI